MEIISFSMMTSSSRVLILEKLTTRELYKICTSIIGTIQNAYSNTNNFSSVKYFETLFSTNNLDWSKNYVLPCITTYNTFTRSFQCKSHMAF